MGAITQCWETSVARWGASHPRSGSPRCGVQPLLDDDTVDEDQGEQVGDGASVSQKSPQPGELVTERVDKAIIDLVRMYEDDELVLRPDWQRYYVWSNKQASQLIESLFLRLPIPLIYLAEEQDQTFSVVDGHPAVAIRSQERLSL